MGGVTVWTVTVRRVEVWTVTVWTVTVWTVRVWDVTVNSRKTVVATGQSRGVGCRRTVRHAVRTPLVARTITCKHIVVLVTVVLIKTAA